MKIRTHTYSGYPDPQSVQELSSQRVKHPALLGQRVVGLVEAFPRITDKEKFKTALDNLFNHIDDVASDPRGSDPAEYVSADDITFFSELMAKAENRMVPPWKNATPITHSETTRHWIKREKRSAEPVLNAEGKPIVGYRVGYLNVAQFEAPVLFCSDGRLRMLIKHKAVTGKRLRGYNTKRSFTGFCRLPDPKFLYPVRTRGTMSGVSFNHGQTNTLRSELKKITGYNFG